MAGARNQVSTPDDEPDSPQVVDAKVDATALVTVAQLRADPSLGFPYRLRNDTVSLRVSDSDGDGVFVATDTFSTVYGAGDDPDEAVANYRDNLCEYYAELEAEESLLAPGLRQELFALRQHIEPII